MVGHEKNEDKKDLKDAEQKQALRRKLQISKGGSLIHGIMKDKKRNSMKLAEPVDSPKSNIFLVGLKCLPKRRQELFSNEDKEIHKKARLIAGLTFL